MITISGHQEFQGEFGRWRGDQEDDHVRGEDAEDAQKREYICPQEGLQQARMQGEVNVLVHVIRTFNLSQIKSN